MKEVKQAPMNIRLVELEKEIKKLKEICDVYVPRALRLEEKNKMLEKENLVMRERLKFGYKGVTREEIDRVEKVNKKLKEENELLKQCLDKLMLDADVINIKIHLELGDYVYVRSDKKLKLNVKD